MARRNYEVSHTIHSELQQRNTDLDKKERVIAVTEDELHPGLVSTGDLEWVCGFGQGHREPDPVPVPVRAKSPGDPKQMQRKRTGPKAP